MNVEESKNEDSEIEQEVDEYSNKSSMSMQLVRILWESVLKICSL